MDISRLQHLFNLYYTKTATAEEKAELMLLVREASPAEMANIIVEEGHSLLLDDMVIPPAKSQAILNSILAQKAPVVDLKQSVNIPGEAGTPAKTPWTRYAVAAAVVFLLGLAAYFIALKKQPAPATIAEVSQPVNDVAAPIGNRAKIILGNGKVVYLDSVQNGTIATEGQVAVRKLADGQIVYDQSSLASDAPMAYNTISNPVASGVISMTLSDGSRVWLNAASTLTYPVAFVGPERKVSVTGEAYFEVAKNKTAPFKVTFNESEVEVLGTHFNINAYADEPTSATTLLEGAIKIRNGDTQKSMTPGNQVKITAGKLQLNAQVDTAEAIAWKNNYFQFNSADIGTIMRQTARWYNVQVDYEGVVPTDRFSGKISRTVNLSQFLKVLQYSEVHFRLNGRKLTVLP